jgi:hypothetical protein
MSNKTHTPTTDGTKWCSRCKEFHPISTFGKTGAKKNGIGYVCTAQFRIDNQVKKAQTQSSQTKLAQPDYDRGLSATEQARKFLSLTQPHLKLANPYKYQRPDAYDNYISALAIASTTTNSSTL